jgi:hypothetical protein
MKLTDKIISMVASHAEAGHIGIIQDSEFEIDEVCSGCVYDFVTGKAWYDVPACVEESPDYKLATGEDIVRLLSKKEKLW